MGYLGTRYIWLLSATTSTLLPQTHTYTHTPTQHLLYQSQSSCTLLFPSLNAGRERDETTDANTPVFLPLVPCAPHPDDERKVGGLPARCVCLKKNILNYTLTVHPHPAPGFRHGYTAFRSTRLLLNSVFSCQHSHCAPNAQVCHLVHGSCRCPLPRFFLETWLTPE